MTTKLDVDVTELWREFKEHPTTPLRNRLVERYLPLVKYNAERIWARLPEGVDLDDLISAGVFGLMDAIDASATLIRLYRLETVRYGARELARIITACTDQVRLGLDALEHHKAVITHAVEINRLENEADRTHQEAVVRLFDGEQDPLVVIKWKETLDFLEAATDRCEDVANVIEGVVVKHG